MNQTKSLVKNKIVLNLENIELAVKIILVAFVNVLFCTNQIISYIAVFIEVLILIIDALQNKWLRYLGDYILFCGLSIEFAVLINSKNIYGFKEFRLFGINMGVLALIPIFLHYLVVSEGKVRILMTKQKDLSKFSMGYFALFIISIFMGLALFLLNDNNVTDFFTLRIFFDELYQKGAQPLLLVSIFYLMTVYENGSSFCVLEKYLLATLYGSVLSFLISFISGRFGYYGGVNTLAATNNVRWVPLLLIFPLYKKYKNRIFLVFIGIVGTYFLVRFNATGKTIMVCILIPLIYILVYFKQHKYISGLIVIAIIPIMVLVGLSIISRLKTVSILFNSKMNQVLSMIRGLFSASIDSIADSPRVRILEFIYTLQEYIKKPYLALLGKGLGGTILRGNLAYDLSSFSKEELDSGLIYNVHETINKLFLSNGILGLVFIAKTIIMSIRKMKNNPWIVIGIYWFLVSLGHSITMSAFGLSCLLFGLMDDEYNSENVENEGI